MSPDCRDGNKHRSCSGDGWCEQSDQAVPCPCGCHRLDISVSDACKIPDDALAEMLASLPQISVGQVGAYSIGIRLGQSNGTHTAMQAKHLSGASIGKLVEYEIGRDLTTGARQWSPAFKLRGLTHSNDEVELEAYGGNYGLKPDDWVRVTQVSA